jgi:putative heme-binding domain-containing protein
LAPTPQEINTAEFPRQLSDTGLFTDVARHSLEPAMISYSVNAPQWSDGADAERYLGVPGTTPLPMPGGRGWNLPDNTVVIKTLSMEMEPGNPASRKRIETQLLSKQQKEWTAYSYAWNDEQTDATLVEKDGSEKILEIKDPSAKEGVRKQVWSFASRTDCMACHSRAANYVLGLTGPQLNKVHDYGDISDNQLRSFAHIGLVEVKLAEHVNRKFNAFKALVQRPLDALVWLTKIFDKPMVAIEEPKYVAPPEQPAAAAVEAKVVQSAWNFPADLALALPAPVEWTRREAIRLRDRVQGALASIDRPVNSLAKSPAEYAHLVNPYDEQASLDARARSYLHANCSQCHVEAGGGNSAIVLEFNRKSPATNLFTLPPKHDKFGLTGAELVAPGDPNRSVLLYRISKLGGGRMPRVGSNEVDVKAEKLLREWIAKMPKVQDDSQYERQRKERQTIIQDLTASGKLSGDELKAKVTELLGTTNGALALLASLESGALKAGEKERVLALAEAHPQPAVRDLFERFVPLDQRVKRLGPKIDRERLLALSGNLERGKNLFFKVAALNCKSCHRIGTGPEQLGPDLNEIGKKYTRPELLEHIVEPSKKVDQKYASYVVQSSDGRVISGLLLKQSEDEVVLRTAENKEVRLPSDEVEEMIVSAKSIMPDQLLRDLTPQQAADLLEYLWSLKPVEATASTQTSN